MADKTSFTNDFDYRQVTRSLINPGDKKTSTSYYKYKLEASAARWNSVLQTFANIGTELSNNVTVNNGFDNRLVWPYNSQTYANTALYAANQPLGAELDTRAQSYLRKKVRDAKGSDFNAAVFVAEANKSVAMIVSASTRIFKMVRALRKGNLSAAYRTLGLRPPKGASKLPKAHVQKNASNYLLEMKYGWVPVLSDTKNAAEKIAKLVVDGVPVCRVRSRQNGSRSVGNVIFTEKVEYGLEYKYASDRIALASSLGLTNPFLIAWEAVPLSFVLDWFIPIGDFLESLSDFHGLEFVDGYQTAVSAREERFSFLGSVVETLDWGGPVIGYYVKTRRTNSASNGFTKELGFVRQKLSSFPSLQPPVFTTKVNWVKGLVAAALIRQRV